MWYGGYVDRLQQGRTGYAESADGIHWTKPALGLHPFAGRATNIVVPLQQGPNSNEYELAQSIVRADDGPPDRRYLLFLHTQGPHGFIVDVAASPDGIRFTRVAHNGRRYGFDDATKTPTLHPAPAVLHEPGYWWLFAGHHEGDNLTTRFTGWVEEPGDTENIGFGLWRSPRRQLEARPGSWETAPPAVRSFLAVGNEWWLYYTSAGSVGLARVGRDRMRGLQLEPGRNRGRVASIAFRMPERGWRGHAFALNASGLTGGAQIRAELVEMGRGVPAGFSSEDCAAIEKDGDANVLSWRGGSLPLSAGNLRVRLTLTRGSGNPQVHGVYLV
jgi:hypothetical protein